MRSLAAVAVLALAVLAAVFVHDHDAWTPDEPRVVALGQSVAQGSWVAPRLNGDPFLEQPPLHAWSVGGAYLAFGESVTVARSVSVAWSVLTLLVTFLLGARLSSPRTGVLAALLLGTSFLFFWAEHRVTADPALAFFVAGSALAALHGLTAETRGARLVGCLLAYSGASLAYLSKGVVGVGLSGFAFLAVIVALRDAKLLLRAHLWLAPLVFVVITGSYHWRLFEECGLQGVKTVVYENTVQRAGTDQQHAQGPEYYLWSFPLNFLPTTLFFLGGVVWFFTERGKLDAKGRLAWEMPLAWFALGFVGLSIAKSKREIYMLPVLPGAALVSALWLERVLAGHADGLTSAARRFLPQALGAVLVLVGIALPVGVGGFLKQPWLLPVLGGAIAVVAGVLGLALGATDRPGRSLAVVLLGALGLAVFADRALVPYGDEQKGLRRPITEAVALIPSNRAVYVLLPDETTLGVVPFYTGRSVAPIPSGSGMVKIEKPFEEARDQLVAHLHGEREMWVIAIEKREEPVVFNTVKALSPEVVHVWSGARGVRLLRFRVGR